MDAPGHLRVPFARMASPVFKSSPPNHWFHASSEGADLVIVIGGQTRPGQSGWRGTRSVRARTDLQSRIHVSANVVRRPMALSNARLGGRDRLDRALARCFRDRGESRICRGLRDDRDADGRYSVLEEPVREGKDAPRVGSPGSRCPSCPGRPGLNPDET